MPNKQKATTPECPGAVRNLSVVPSVGPPDPLFKEFQMKKIIVALVLALSMAAIVGGTSGCSSAPSTPAKTGTGAAK
jgi:hypothetical protein